MIDLALLAKLYPVLAEELEKDDEAPPVEITVETAATGVPSMVINGLHVHSPRDPVREARRLTENIEGDGPIVILGFGLGYAVEAAAAVIAAEAGAKAPDGP